MGRSEKKILKTFSEQKNQDTAAKNDTRRSKRGRPRKVVLYVEESDASD
jgi:hypothetical protein